MNETITIIIQCILLIPTIATIGAFWFMVFITLIDGISTKESSDKEVEGKSE